MPKYLKEQTLHEDLAICQENINNKEYHLALTQLKTIEEKVLCLPDIDEKIDHLNSISMQESQLLTALDDMSNQELSILEQQELDHCVSWLVAERPERLDILLIALNAFYKLNKQHEAQELSTLLLEATHHACHDEQEKSFLKMRYSLFLLQHNQEEAAHALELWLGLQPNLSPFTVLEKTLEERFTLIHLYRSCQQDKALRHLDFILEYQEDNKEALRMRCELLKEKGDEVSLIKAAHDELVLKRLDVPKVSGHSHTLWQDVKYVENRKRSYVREEDEPTPKIARSRTS